jgi:hypothetical protein
MNSNYERVSWQREYEGSDYASRRGPKTPRDQAPTRWLYLSRTRPLVVKAAQSGLRAGFMSIPALKSPMSVAEMTEIAAEEAGHEFAIEDKSQG